MFAMTAFPKWICLAFVVAAFLIDVCDARDGAKFRTLRGRPVSEIDPIPDNRILASPMGPSMNKVGSLADYIMVRRCFVDVVESRYLDSICLSMK